MAEENTRPPEEGEFTGSIPNTNDILKRLRAIGSDFWGEMPEAAEQAEPTAEQPKVKPSVVRRDVIGIDNLWMTADETIEWTDALSHVESPDGLTDPALWAFYHTQAEKVLSGDLKAYAQVLRRTNPLSDLAAFSDGMTMRAPAAERLEATFVCKPRLLEEKGKQYLCAMGLRMARDLLACLPAEEVGITATSNGKTVMQVTYPREKLLHRNYRFLDPVALTEECGAVFTA